MTAPTESLDVLYRSRLTLLDHLDTAGYNTAPFRRFSMKEVGEMVKAGANGAITQMFFNSDAYFRFVDDAHALGADIPVVPGIMPITNASGIMRFADSCGTEIPRWMRLRLMGFGDDTESIRAFGLDVITDLCDQLRTAGVPGLHFYTMNQSTAVLEICRRLGL